MKKNKSIGQELVRADIFGQQQKGSLHAQWNLKPIEGHHKCGNCVACESTIEGTEFVHQKIKWKHLQFTNCKNRNVVYAVTCPCNKIYIGKTNQQVNQRITQHRSRIKNKVLTAPMVEHFVAAAHTERECRWTVLVALNTQKGKLMWMQFPTKGGIPHLEIQ